MDVKPITSGSPAPSLRSHPDCSEKQGWEDEQAPEHRQILFNLIVFAVLQIAPKPSVPACIPSTACSCKVPAYLAVLSHVHSSHSSLPTLRLAWK